MSFFQRVAAIAAVSLSFAGIASPGSAVQAAELAQAAFATPALMTLNPSIAGSVPVRGIAVDTLPDLGTMITTEARPDDVTAYPSLAAAVAAQSAPTMGDEQLRCLAGAIYFESKGEPLAGQLAVAQVILNRADAGRFGNSLCAVVKQPGQFSFVRGGRIPDIDANRAAYRTAVAVAKVAMTDAWDSSCGRALYFHARRVSPRWNRTRVASIGNHVFYR